MVTLLVFSIYFATVLAVGLVAGRRGHEDPDEYFLAGRRLPWYAVGLSMIGSNISTEHFIGMVGAAYAFGVAPANFELLAFFALSLLIFFFLPYYYRKKIYTVPQFLENRYNATTRVLFALLTLTHMVIVLLAGSLYAGGLLFENLVAGGEATREPDTLSATLLVGIGVVALTTGAYSIYGGLSSVVWTDVMQTVILLAAGAFVSYTAVQAAGGVDAVWRINAEAEPARMQLIKPADDGFAPWPGTLALFLTLGVWYNCTNQFYIQRCFGAKSEWDSRMGIVLAAFLKQWIPLLVVLPGLAAFAAYGVGLDRDLVFITLLRDRLGPIGEAVVMTGMTAAIMSTVSSVLNSSSTIYTIDVHQRFFSPDASQEELVRVGRIATAVVLLIGVVWAPLVALLGEGLFIYIQDMAAFFAPSIAAIFFAGILWRGATATAANTTLVLGVAVGIALKVCLPLFPEAAAGFLEPFLNRALVNWLISLAILWFVSVLTKPSKDRGDTTDAVWSPSWLVEPHADGAHADGAATNRWVWFWSWWGLVLSLRLGTYAYFLLV